MKYNFDAIISRRGTNCEKLDRCGKLFGQEDVIPMWVADMDFTAPQPVIDAIKKRAEHPIFGYSYRTESYFDSIRNWVGRRAGWNIKNEWIDFSPGVVSGFVFAIRAFSAEGDGVVIQPPVYHPFARQIKLNERKVLNNPVKFVNGRFEIDFEDLDRKLSQAKLFLMSNPHNPTGRVFTREELIRIGELCVKHDVIILSDEIHADLIYKPNKHIHIASVCDDFAARTITFIAPSKTFNVAGLSTSVVIAPNDTLRRGLHREFEKLHADQGNMFGMVALEAAYNHGEEWLEQVLDYLKGNIDYVIDFLKTNLPSVKYVVPEGTYLMWLDFSGWGMEHDDIYRLIVDRAKIAVNEGTMFGEEGKYWMRFNIATQRSNVVLAMEQLAAAYQNR